MVADYLIDTNELSDGASNYQTHGLMQEKQNSIASALEVPLSCINPSRCGIFLVEVL